MSKKKYRNIIAAILMMATGTAQAQTIESALELVDCGQVEFRKPITVNFKLKNNTGKPFSITEATTDCGCTTIEIPRATIAAGEEYKVTAVYDAKTLGRFVKRAYLTLNNSLEPLRLTIRGIVVDEVVSYAGGYHYTLGALMVDQNDIEFEDVNRGAKPYKTIHILNTSDQPSQPQIMDLPPYLTAEVSPTTIAPGHSGEATITLDSHKLRDFGLSQTSIYLGFAQGDKIAADKEITVSAVLLPDFEMLSQEELEDAPHITLSADSLNLGAFNGKKKKRGEIEITNTGLSLLDIRSLQMSTTGLQLSLNKTKIEPGESAKLKVTPDAEDFKTIRKTPRILMITNDPNNAKVEIKVKATLR